MWPRPDLDNHNRRRHQVEVEAFLQRQFSLPHWDLKLPHGSGNEKYIASSGEQVCFIKVGAQPERYQILASLGLVPPVLATGILDDGTPVLVQPFIAGREPSCLDFRTCLEQIANTISKVHHSLELRRILPGVPCELFSCAAERSLSRIRQRWERCRAQVPFVAHFVDESLDHLARQVGSFQGAGLVVSHNDICNANWRIARDEQIYMLDLESMALEDPACDVGAILWWYYPPELRPRFLEILGYPNDESFRHRMQVRMAMHCLHILLPRQGSFDRFNPGGFAASLVDFRAAFAGEENPQGYLD